jgi:malate permease and related proteins
MILQLGSIFLDVVAPVFAIAALGYVLGPRLALDARTLARIAYYVFVPAFTFDVISRAHVPLARAGRMALYLVAAHLVFAAIGWAVARLLRRPPETVAAYVMLSVFGNVGNFGLALVQFRIGPDALVPATIYFVVSLLVSFVVCVGVAAGVRGGRLSAVASVFKTPALVAAVPALLVSSTGAALPLFAGRVIGLLSSAMIPAMLLTLGLQLAQTRALRITTDVGVACALRLLASPVVAALLVAPFGLSGVDRSVSIIQAAMPAAVLVTIISSEYRIAPEFVMSTVFFSTLGSLPVLTVLLAMV